MCCILSQWAKVKQSKVKCFLAESYLMPFYLRTCAWMYVCVWVPFHWFQSACIMLFLLLLFHVYTKWKDIAYTNISSVLTRDLTSKKLNRNGSIFPVFETYICTYVCIWVLLFCKENHKFYCLFSNCFCFVACARPVSLQ